MIDGLVRWPRETAEAYRRAGYWRGVTLGGLLSDWAGRHADRVAVVDGDLRLTYAELDARAHGLAAALASLGVGRGDRIIVQLPSSASFLVLVFALFRLGALPVMALPPHREHEIGYLAELSGAVAYAVPGEWRRFDHRELARAVRQRAPSLAHVLVTGGEAQEFTDLDTLIAPGPPLPDAADHGDVALFLLSGGTTGLPKLIPRTHDDYAYNLTRSAEVCGFDADTVYLVALPIGHNFPLGCPGVLGTLSVGGRVVLAPDPDPETAFPLIERERVTTTALVPALALRWLEAADQGRWDLSSLAFVQVGGARIAPEAARRIRPGLGAQLQQVFGMAEGLLNYTRLDDPDEVVVETQGRPMSDGDEIRVVGLDGQPVPDGTPGSLETRGPYTLRGYWRAEQHNARAFTADGFYRTGDVVRVRPDGNLVVEGREKDLINRGGEKISAEEVENLVLSHPAVQNVAAVAMPDPMLGERTCVYVVLRPAAALDLDGLVAHLRARGIASFKLPERLEVVNALPLTNVGKIDKAALRADVAGKIDKEFSMTATDLALEQFYADVATAELQPLWTQQNLMPGDPTQVPKAVPHLWRWSTMRALAERAGALIPLDRGGDRRVLSMANPGLGGRPYATPTLWGAIQYLNPGEHAPGHRHTPGAIRFVLEGDGVYTTVDGDACDMHPGDLVLTPSWNWHDHNSDSHSPMIWFDGLDIPLVVGLDAVFFEPYPVEELQPVDGDHNRSAKIYGGRGLLPDADRRAGRAHSPLLVYPRAETDAALAALVEDRASPDAGLVLVSVEYVNPVDGRPALPTMGCHMVRIVPGGRTTPRRRVGSEIYVVYSGAGESVIGGTRFRWSAGDAFVVPSWAAVEHEASEPSDLFLLDDEPVLRALALDRSETLDAPQPVMGEFHA